MTKKQHQRTQTATVTARSAQPAAAGQRTARSGTGTHATPRRTMASLLRSPANILALQRTIGNRATRSTVAPAGVPGLVQRDIIIFPPLGSQGGGRRLNLRQACEELAEAGYADIVFQTVVEMVRENWFSHSIKAYINTARQRSQGKQGSTINDIFANMVQEQANQLTTGQVQEVQDQDLKKYIGDNQITDLEMDSPDVIRGMGIATTGLATCVAVGFTATHGQHRYNAIYHWSGVESPPGVFAAFREAFDGAGNTMPKFSQLQNVTYYVVGGSRDSVLSQLHLLEYMGQMGLNISAITLRNSPQEKEMSKAVVILPNGTAVYSVEDE